MMIIGREGGDIEDGSVISKKEAGGRGKTSAASSAAASSSSWSRLKDPRIVRVSRAFGGKDRHSKVCTVRGLRDRRVRLSVPTAIQLYDLQDRLGLNQPSKVVDWLLNAAKDEIDELPPLQMPPNSSSSSGNFLTHHHHNFQPLMLASNNSHHQQLQRPMKIGYSTANWDGDDDDNNDHSILRTKAKEEEEEEDDSAAAAAAATRESNVEEEDNNTLSNNSRHAAFMNASPSNNFFSSRNSSTTQTNGGLGLLNSISSSAPHQSQQQQQPYNSLMRWDPSTLSLAQSQPQSHPVMTDDFHSNFNVASLGSGPLHNHHRHHHQHHQVLVYQPGAAGGIAAGHSYFPSHINAANANEYAPKQINFQMLMSSSSTNSVDNSNSLTQAANEGRPFHLTTNFLPTTQKDCRK